MNRRREMIFTKERSTSPSKPPERQRAAPYLSIRSETSLSQLIRTPTRSGSFTRHLTEGCKGPLQRITRPPLLSLAAPLPPIPTSWSMASRMVLFCPPMTQLKSSTMLIIGAWARLRGMVSAQLTLLAKSRIHRFKQWWQVWRRTLRLLWRRTRCSWGRQMHSSIYWIRAQTRTCMTGAPSPSASTTSTSGSRSAQLTEAQTRIRTVLTWHHPRLSRWIPTTWGRTRPLIRPIRPNLPSDSSKISRSCCHRVATISVCCRIKGSERVLSAVNFWPMVTSLSDLKACWLPINWVLESAAPSEVIKLIITYSKNQISSARPKKGT